MDKFTEFISSASPTLINFYATWCEPCSLMHLIIDELRCLIGTTAQIAEVDVNAPGNKFLTSRFEINAVPTIIIFKNGEVVWRQSEMAHAQTLKNILQTV